MIAKSDNYQNNYQFDGGSVINQPGFASFQHPADGEFYFRYNDENGRPVLFSEGYEEAKGRENGIESVLRNAPKKERFKVLEEGGKWVVALRAGNNQEIARSLALEGKTEAERLLNWLVDNVTAAQAAPKTVEAPPVAISVSLPSEVLEVQAASQASNILSSEMEIGLGQIEATVDEPKEMVNRALEGLAVSQRSAKDPKYVFRVELYPRKNEELAGAITNVLTEEKENFRGVNGEKISDFIIQYLSEEERALLGAKLVSAAAKPETKAVDETKLVENISIELVEGPKANKKQNWGKDASFDIRLKYLGEDVPKGSNKMQVRLYSIQDRSLHSEIAADVDFAKDNFGYLSGFQKLSRTGIYRLKVMSAPTSNENVLYGSTVFNVY